VRLSSPYPASTDPSSGNYKEDDKKGKEEEETEEVTYTYVENTYYFYCGRWRIGVQIIAEKDDEKPTNYLHIFAYLTTLSVSHAIQRRWWDDQ
jgi:hypothetical protein